MVEIVPAILEKDFASLQNRIKQVEPYVKTAHLDIMDGQFVPNTTFNNPRELNQLETKLEIWMHLMIDEPEKYIKEWASHKVAGIIFHVEAGDDAEATIKDIKNLGKKVGVALNPETPVSLINDVLDQVDFVLVMGVFPGFAGQELQPHIMEKIRQLKSWNPKLSIGIDGGVNLENAKDLVKAGANVLAANTLIFKDDQIEQNLSQLRKLVGH